MNHKIIVRILGGTVLVVTLAVLMPDVSAAQESSDATTPTFEMSGPPVFEPPPQEELVKITHPELREELLLMVYEDQEARRRGP